jgi:competence protein ComEC
MGRNSILGIVSIALAFSALGFLRANKHIAKYDFPTVKYNLGRVLIYGDIEDEILNFSGNGDPLKYIVVNVDRIEAINKNGAFARDSKFKFPQKVRVKLRNPREEIKFGPSQVEATLVPIEGKKFGSEFDLQMYFYFRKIGSTGYGGVIKKQGEEVATVGRRRQTFRQRINEFRRKLAVRIISVRQSLSTNMIATILTGYRGLVNRDLMKLINNLGLASTLSVSSVHMLILSQAVLLVLKEILDKFNALASEFNVYKISAAISLLINSLYLLVGGFSISSVRAYTINVINLFSIMLDRFNNPLRSVMFSMFGMILIRPDLLFRIGFYMSFISSLVMIAFVNYYYTHEVDEQMHFRSGFTESLRTNFIISLLIEAAMAPLEIYSFNTFSFYKIMATMVINPVISFLVIPIGLLSLILYPLGAESFLIYPLSYVVDGVIVLLKLLGRMPGSVIRVQSPSITTMAIIVFGILWASLWTQSWRKLGICLYVFGLLSIIFTKKPDVIVDNNNGIVIFFDERNRAYAYGSNKRQIRNILGKFGKNNYLDLSLERLDSCGSDGTQKCSRVQLGVDSLVFHRNGHDLKIHKGKNFRLGEGASNFNIVHTKKPSRGRPWFNSCSRQREKLLTSVQNQDSSPWTL